MDTWLAFCGAALLLLAGYLAWHFVLFGDNKGLPVYPFVGAVPVLLEHMADFYEYLTGIVEKSPNMALFGALPGKKFCFTANPEHFKHILKDNFENYPKGDEFHDIAVELLGEGIFTSDGEAWKQQRKIASYEFSTNSLRRMMMTSFHSEIQDRLLPTLASVSASGKQVNMQDVFLRYTIDSICKIGFGVDPGALSPDFPDLPFMRSFDHVAKIVSYRSIVSPVVWKTLRAFGWGFEGDLVREMKVVNQFVKDVILTKRRELAEEATGQEATAIGEEFDLLSRMIALGERDHGQLFSDSFLRDSCLNFLLAGRDTTAVALTWLFWLLAQHPDVEEKVLAEVTTILSNRKGGPEVEGTPFSFDELRQMSYLMAVINETLRLYPPVPVDMKTAAADDTWPDGTQVKKGWRINYSIFSAGRMTRVWGPDAADFRPERWLMPGGDVKLESPFKFLAFNAGPRLCLGREMAYLQMKSVVASILRRYHLELMPGFKVSYVPSMTFMMQHGLPVTLCQRGVECM